MNLNKIAITLFIILMTTTNLICSNKISLSEAVKIALEKNYDIKIAESESQISKNNLTMGNAGFLPSLDLTGRINNASQNVQQEFLDGRIVNRDGAKSNSYEGNFGLNWTIFDGMKMFVNYDRLSELKGIGELKFKSKVENTIKDISILYYTAITNKKQIEIITENLKISRKRYEFAKNKFEVGTASKFELLQANIDLNSDISDSIDKKNVFENSIVEFKRFLNLDFNSDIELVDEIKVDTEIVLSNEVNKFENNTDIKITKKSIEVNKYDIEAIKADYFPKISLYSNLTYNRQSAEAGFLSSSTSNGFNYGVNFSMNVFDGFNTSLDLQNAQVNTLIADYMLKNLSEMVKSSIVTTYNTYLKFKELSKFEKENLQSARENMDLALESLNVGLISPVEFRESQHQLANAQLRLIMAEYNAKTSEVELKRLTGSILNN
jgi:outer membrane protein TolC